MDDVLKPFVSTESKRLYTTVDDWLRHMALGITRVEIIEAGVGRVYVKMGLDEVELSLQDEGRTLKIFTKAERAKRNSDVLIWQSPADWSWETTDGYYYIEVKEIVWSAYAKKRYLGGYATLDEAKRACELHELSLK